MTPNLTELAALVERADESAQGDMILAALSLMHPKPDADYQPRRDPNFAPAFSEWAKLDAKVNNFVQLGAFHDAAMTLFDPEWFWRSGHHGDGPDPSMFHAEVLVCDGLRTTKSSALALTEPLARVSAALRARATPNDGGGK